MEDDINKMYEEIVRLSKKISELDQRSAEIESVISSLDLSSKPKEPENPAILDQETITLDPHNIGGYRNLSMPNGGVMKVKATPFCVNGRHVVRSVDDITFCAKCSSIFCEAHAYPTEEPMCEACIKDTIRDFDPAAFYALFAARYGIPLRKLRKRLNMSRSEIKPHLEKLVSSGCMKQNMLFRYSLLIFSPSR